MYTLLDEILLEQETGSFGLPGIMTTVSQTADKIKRWLQQGILSAQLLGRFAKGEITDMNKLTNEVFYIKNPIAKRRKLTTAEAALWKKIRQEIVIPVFGNPANFAVPSSTDCIITDLRKKVPKQIVKKGPKGTFNLVAGERDSKKVTAIILHQMAFTRGNNLNSYLEVGAHYIVLQDGQIGQLRNNVTYLNASNCFNGNGVAIEFAGNMPDIKYNWWPGSAKEPARDRNFITPAQIQAGRCLIKKIKTDMASITSVQAHRQTSGDRDNCPGPDIWYNVGEWGISNLGLTDKDKLGKSIAINCGGSKGNSIPDAWRKSRSTP